MNRMPEVNAYLNHCAGPRATQGRGLLNDLCDMIVRGGSEDYKHMADR